MKQSNRDPIVLAVAVLAILVSLASVYICQRESAKILGDSPPSTGAMEPGLSAVFSVEPTVEEEESATAHDTPTLVFEDADPDTVIGNPWQECEPGSEKTEYEDENDEVGAKYECRFFTNRGGFDASKWIKISGDPESK